MGLGIRGWRRVGLGTCKVGGVGSRSNHAPWVLCSVVLLHNKICSFLASRQPCSSTLQHPIVMQTDLLVSVNLRFDQQY